MSEFINNKADSEEKSVSFGPVDVSPSDTVENKMEDVKRIADVGNSMDNFADPGSWTTENSREYEENETQRLGAATEGQLSDLLPNRDENVKIYPGPSASLKQQDNFTDSQTVSDKKPLLENESLNRGSSSDLTTEGDTETSETSCECSIAFDRDSDQSSLNSMLASQTRDNLMVPGSVKVPIVGHETMESRSKFTVFKIHVMVEADDPGWFIFRRYSDFVHLNDQLKVLFPNFRLSLPPKRWFKSNFDLDFLEERVLGLQAFVDNVTGHRDICNSKPVRDFFCFDDPPGPHDSLEESRAQCESMEEMVYSLRKEIFEKDTEIQLLKEELDLYKNQVLLLTNRLGELKRRSSFERSGSHKVHSPARDGHLDMNILLQSGEKLLAAKKPDTVTKPRSPHLRGNEQISGTQA